MLVSGIASQSVAVPTSEQTANQRLAHVICSPHPGYPGNCALCAVFVLCADASSHSSIKLHGESLLEGGTAARAPRLDRFPSIRPPHCNMSTANINMYWALLVIRTLFDFAVSIKMVVVI